MRNRLAIWLLAASAVLSAAGADAQEKVTPAIAAEIQHVIADQIDAFRHDDGTRALGFATTALRSKFGDGPQFLAMVRTAYPVVYRVRNFDFGTLLPGEGVLQQKVELVGPGGETRLGVYDMVHEVGGWRIAGCALVASERIAI